MNDPNEQVVRTDTGGLVSEEMPSLADFATEPGGAWPAGWYAAEVIEGYSTGKGTVFTTADAPSKDGQSRNLKVCLKLNGATLGVRNTFGSFNYRTSDFDAARLEQVKQLREQFKGTRGAWQGQTDAQRTSLAIASLGQFEKALGFKLKRAPSGNLNPSPFLGQKVDVRLAIDEKGYNEVTAYAPAGTRVK